MKVAINVTKNFKKEAKLLMKKYKSLPQDLMQLEKELNKIPRLGTPLGNDCFKIRLKIASKAKGKSGGARVITLVETEITSIAAINITEEEISVTLLSIFDKSEVDNLSDKELKDLIKLYKK